MTSSKEQAMDGDRPKPLDGPRDAADFLSLFLPEVSSTSILAEGNFPEAVSNDVSTARYGALH